MSAPTRPTQARIDVVLSPDDGQRLANLAGPFDAHLRQIELRLGIEIRNRGNLFQLVGTRADAQRGEAVLNSLFNLTLEQPIGTEQVHLALERGLPSTPSLPKRRWRVRKRPSRARSSSAPSAGWCGAAVPSRRLTSVPSIATT